MLSYTSNAKYEQMNQIVNARMSATAYLNAADLPGLLRLPCLMYRKQVSSSYASSSGNARQICLRVISLIRPHRHFQTESSSLGSMSASVMCPVLSVERFPHSGQVTNFTSPAPWIVNPMSWYPHPKQLVALSCERIE